MFSQSRNIVLLLAIVLVVAVAAVACAPEDVTDDPPDDPADPVDEKRGGTVVFGRLQEPETLDIHRTPWLDALLGSMQATLLNRAEDGSFIPGLAEDWELSECETEITLFLRDDVTFHDGEPFNAEAVKFTYERMTDPDLASPGAHNWGPVERVEVIDEFTVKIVYSEIYARAFESLTSNYLAPLSPAAVEKYGDDDFGTNPVGAGPFKFERWDLGSEIVVVRNEDYDWGPEFAENTGAPYVDEIVFRFIPDETARVTALETGQLDLIAMAPPRDILRLEQDPDFEVVPVMATGIVYLGINCSKEPWDDPRLRQAAAWGASGRDEIIEKAFEGLAIPIYGHLAPHIHPGYYEEVEEISYKYDPDKSREILEELGYEEGADGYYEKDGETLELETWVTDDPTYQRVAVVLQEQLANAGIKMNIVQMDDATLFARTHEGVHDAIIAYYGFQDPDILYYFFHSSRLETTNRIHYVNPYIDELLEVGRATLDFDERFEIYREVQEILLEDAPWVPLLVREEPLAHTTRLQGLRVHPVTMAIIWNDMWME